MPSDMTLVLTLWILMDKLNYDNEIGLILFLFVAA